MNWTQQLQKFQNNQQAPFNQGQQQLMPGGLPGIPGIGGIGFGQQSLAGMGFGGQGLGGFMGNMNQQPM